VVNGPDSDGLDREWEVRPVRGQDARKLYRCPGCDHEIRIGEPHVVAWPSEHVRFGGDQSDRRHWHTACWRARHRSPRAPRRRSQPQSRTLR
jgi:hypothetical protein